MAGTGDGGSSITQRRKSIKRSSRRGKVHSRQDIVVATWNVRTLVEDAGGDRRICRSRPQSRADRRNSPQKPGPHLVNRKLDFLARELKRYGMSIAAIQETKWYGNDVWQANGYTFLHSGRPLPCAEETAVRNEGVGIMLDESASAAWREAWEAISSRVVTARLKAMGRGQRRPGGARTTRNSFISVISAYAPTARAPPGIKLNSWRSSRTFLTKFHRQICCCYLEISMLVSAVVIPMVNCGGGFGGDMVLGPATRQGTDYWSSVQSTNLQL